MRAEDGRRVENVDISPFINNLPGNIDTRRFCSDEASGSTSQAANILEPITPFIDKVGQLRAGHGVSTVLVAGGSGDYFDVADTVVQMDESQTRAIAEIMRYAAEHKRYFDGRRSLREALGLVLQDIRREGLEVLSPFGDDGGSYALPRIFEIGGALNRYRRLRVIA